MNDGHTTLMLIVGGVLTCVALGLTIFLVVLWWFDCASRSGMP